MCVQRFPTLSREKADLEKRYEEMFDTVRVERSRLSDFELEEKEHLRQKKERERRALEDDSSHVSGYTVPFSNTYVYMGGYQCLDL